MDDKDAYYQAYSYILYPILIIIKYQLTRFCIMTETCCNGPLTICSVSQYRIRLEGKLKKLLGEERIIGPLEIPIRKCIESGAIDADKGKELIEISRFCDAAYTLPESAPPSEETIKSWSGVIEAL